MEIWISRKRPGSKKFKDEAFEKHFGGKPLSHAELSDALGIINNKTFL